MGLFPEFEIPSMAPATEQSSKNQNVKSYFFDFKTGDFRINGSGKAVLADPVDSWIQWCVKAVNTERFRYRAYSQQYGAELEGVNQYDQKGRESWIERTISETLLADPLQRTAYAKDFSYFWKSDTVKIVFTVVGQDGMEATLATSGGKINGGH